MSKYLAHRCDYNSFDSLLSPSIISIGIRNSQASRARESFTNFESNEKIGSVITLIGSTSKESHIHHRNDIVSKGCTCTIY
ncbi:unnamed protein product [Blepharisma stoltei]|uniref:Uncharacterized protein n=1 Tax=Blepharisma stoltei TaxID=1481888 RepID=A0AAU9IPG9_9CILI|nr:unnamed protein product [Blepharisma stoltei]